MKRIVLSAALTASVGWMAWVWADGGPTASRPEINNKAGEPAGSLPTAWPTIVADTAPPLAKRLAKRDGLTPAGGLDLS